jgi:hypothetical protein
MGISVTRQLSMRYFASATISFLFVLTVFAAAGGRIVHPVGHYTADDLSIRHLLISTEVEQLRVPEELIVPIPMQEELMAPPFMFYPFDYLPSQPDVEMTIPRGGICTPSIRIAPDGSATSCGESVRRPTTFLSL